MKLTTRRNRWYFLRELFLYMIPMVLIMWTIDVFYHFMVCPLHPEWSAPCSINWIIAAIYWVLLLLIIICAIISSKFLRKVKKKIENEFINTINNYTEQVNEKKVKSKHTTNNKNLDKKSSANKWNSKSTARKNSIKK